MGIKSDLNPIEDIDSAVRQALISGKGNGAVGQRRYLG